MWWLTSDFVVTSSRVIHREGFIAKRSMEIPLDKINDVRFEQGIFERMVGAGTLVIQSASESGRNEFKFIRHPEEVQRTIYHESEADQTRTVQRATPPPSAAAAVRPRPPPNSSASPTSGLAACSPKRSSRRRRLGSWARVELRVTGGRTPATIGA